MNFVNLPPEWNNTGTEPSQTLKDNGFAPGYKPPAAVFNWYWSKVGACLSEIQKNVLGKKFVASLPSSSRYYDFGTVTAFTAVERCTLDLISESTEKFLRVTTADNAGNKYALAQLNFADIGQTADSFVIEMDTRMPSSRWYISFVDLSKRPGTSNKISYDLTGVAFSCGTTDGAEYNVNGVSVLGNTFADAWLSMKVTINVKAKSIKYEIKERDSNTVLATETVSFRDSGVDKITGIELYSYTQTTIDIDNIKITAGHDIEENILYCVGTDDVYDTYIYIDSEPVLISSQTDVKSLKEIGHAHNNKDVLDGISSSDISNWNSKADGSHTHSQYATIESPKFSGKPTAPTPDDNESSSQIATTLYVRRILETSYSGDLDNIFAESTDVPVNNLLCIGANNTPNSYNGTLSCVMTYYDQSGYGRHKYSQSYIAGPNFDEYTRSYEYGSGWTSWEVVK